MNFWLCVAALACLAAFDCHWLPAGVELRQIYLTVGQSQGSNWAVWTVLADNISLICPFLHLAADSCIWGVMAAYGYYSFFVYTNSMSGTKQIHPRTLQGQGAKRPRT